MGKLVCGMLAERAGARVAAMVNLTGQAVFATALALATSHVALALAVPAFGVFMGGFGILNTLLVQDTYGLRHFGAIMGLVGAFTVVSYGLGPILAGLSFDVYGSYGPGFVVVAFGFLLAVVALAVTPIRPGRPIA